MRKVSKKAPQIQSRERREGIIVQNREKFPNISVLTARESLTMLRTPPVDLLPVPPAGLPHGLARPTPRRYRVSVDQNSHRVLIVDRSAESREILRTLLERSGTAAILAARPDEATTLAVSARPDLIVLDADSDLSEDHQASRQLSDAARRTSTPIVVLGKFSRQTTPLAAGEHLAKPYHYGHLLRKIADVLEEHRAA